MLTETWGPGSILREVGGGRSGVAGSFWGEWGGGGLAQKKTKTDFRCPEAGISVICRHGKKHKGE